MEADATPTRSLTELLEAIQKPISDDAPAGIDVAYEDSFLQLKTEIDKIGSASGAADYDRIVALGSGIVTEQSKDLNAACYLALALCRTSGWAGAGEGLAAVHLLMRTFWEELYPVKRRMNARRNALQFLIERLTMWVEQTKPEPADRDSVEWAVEEVEAMQTLVLELMDEEAPAFSLLLRNLREALRKLPAPEPEPGAPEAPATDGAPGGDGSASATASPTSTAAPAAAEAPAELRSSADASRSILRAVQFLREQSPYDPVAFRVIRGVRFGVLTDLPPNEGGRTRLEAPPAVRRNALSGMLEQGNHEVLVAEAEASFQQSPFHFWLDLQRLVATALGSLGAPARAAHEAVLDEVVALHRRLPGLVDLSFQDGTPFAEPMTADWIAEQAAERGAGGEATPRPSVDDDLGDALATARAKMAEGDLAAALRMLDQPAPPRPLFRRRVAAAEMCLKGNRPEIARSILEGLEHTLGRHGLEEWEPELALQMLGLLHRSYQAMAAKAAAAEKAELRQRASAVFERLCRLDPAAAVVG